MHGNLRTAEEGAAAVAVNHGTTDESAPFGLIIDWWIVEHVWRTHVDSGVCSGPLVQCWRNIQGSTAAVLIEVLVERFHRQTGVGLVV